MKLIGLGAAFTSLCLSSVLVQGFRVVKNQVGTTVDVWSGNATNDQNLKKMEHLTPTNVLVDLPNNIGKINWNSDIAKEMERYALMGLQKVAGMVNPFLGAIFSVIIGVFFPGPDKEQKLIEKILKQVDGMIKDGINGLRNTLSIQELSGLREMIADMGNNRTEWTSTFPTQFSPSYPRIFKTECWDASSPNTDGRCTTYRTSGGGGGALLNELLFTDLMLTSGVTGASHGAHRRSNWCTFALRTLKAHNLLNGHWKLFNAYRQEWGSSMHGLKSGGGVACGGRFNNRSCEARPFQDLITKQRKCGEAKRSCGSGSFSACRERYESRYNRCEQSYKNDLIGELKMLKQGVDATGTAVNNLLRAGGCR